MKAKRLFAGIFLGLGLVAALQLLILGPVSKAQAASLLITTTDNNSVGFTPPAIGLFAIINVNTTSDGLNDGDGNCSLREAIQAANTDAVVDGCPAGSGDDTIVLIAGAYVLTLTGANENANATGDLDISSNITIQGIVSATTIINGNAADRVFDIASGVVSISDVTITNGRDTEGGGIRNQGKLSIVNTTVSTNTATEIDGGGIINKGSGAVLTVTTSFISGNLAEGGGGIFNENGVVTINSSTISNNTADATTNPSGSGGLGVGVGGGLANSAESSNATLTINNSTISGNKVIGVGGGGISNSANASRTATTVVNNSIISTNVATSTTSEINANRGFGGGIRNGFFSTANSTSQAIVTVNTSTIKSNFAFNGGGIGNGTSVATFQTLSATINNSTISGNTASHNGSNGDGMGNGGGLVNQDGTLAMTNSTVSGNTVVGGSGLVSGLGGGIGNSNGNKVSTTSLTNVTINNNTASSGTGIANVRASVTLVPNVNFKNTILAGTCVNPNFGAGSGTLTSNGNNLGIDTSCNITHGVNGDIVNATPLLGPLQNNGGSTETHALLSGSPAIDAGTCSGAPTTDQRGQARPNAISAFCDIGAYESSFSAAPGSVSVFLPIVIKT